MLALTFLIRCWNSTDVFVAGRVFFLDPDCYSRMTRVRQVVEHPGTVVREHDFENWPEGTHPHTTAPFDYLTAALTFALRMGCRDSQLAMDRAGALISPLLAVAAAAFLWGWAGRLGLQYRAPMLVLFATSPILVHGTVLGRPDHQSLLIVCMAVALGAEAALLEREKERTSPKDATPLGKPSFALLAGLAWGLALWVSLYEPVVLLTAVLAFKAIAARWRQFRESRTVFLTRLLALAGVAAVAGLVDGWSLPIPDPEVVRAFPNWSRTIGELAPVPLLSPLLMRWTLLWLPFSPLLLVWAGWSRHQAELAAVPSEPASDSANKVANPDLRAWFWLVLLLLTLALTCMQMRWGYFLALVFAMSLPWQLAVFPKRWVAIALFCLALWPNAREWSGTLFPGDAGLALRAERRADNLALYDAAQQLRGTRRLPVLAPWWQSPALAYWSRQPCVAGSSHESLSGIVDASRFYVCEDPRQAEAILARRKVACVLAYDPDRVMDTSRTILGMPGFGVALGDVHERAMAVMLFRRPHSPPAFLKLAYGNLAFRVFLYPPALEDHCHQTSAPLPFFPLRPSKIGQTQAHALRMVSDSRG